MLQRLREKLSILPEYIEHKDGTETDIPPRWWNWSWEHHGDRIRIMVGDMAAVGEHEDGEPGPLRLRLDLEMGADSGQFDGYSYSQDKITPRYHDHDFDLIIGRWGIYIAMRGRKRSA